MNVVLDRVPALNPHQRRQFVLPVRALDVGRRERHHHAVRMPRRLFVHRIDQVERVPREMALVGLRINPDREELRAQISAPRLVEADVADVVGIGRADVESFVEKPLRRVGVGVHDQRGIVNLLRTGAHRSLSGGAPFPAPEQRAREEISRKTRNRLFCHKCSGPRTHEDAGRFTIV